MAVFVSYAGPDPRTGVRPEVRVQKGTAIIKKVDDERGGGKTVQVILDDTNPKMREDVKGWLRVEDKEVYDLVVAAQASGEEVEYRIETQRKPDKDPAVPIEVLRGVPEDKIDPHTRLAVAGVRASQDISRDNVLNKLVGINGHLTSERLTLPEEDPSGGAVAAQPGDHAPQRGGQAGSGGGGFSAPQALAGLAAARQFGADPQVVAAAEALAFVAGASPQDVAAAGVQSPQTERPEVRRGVAREEPPYKLYNTDGRPNAGSYAVTAALTAVRFAYDQIEANHAAYAEANGSEPEAVNAEQVEALAGVLLALADDVQLRVTGLPAVDRSAHSHTHARGLVYEAVERFPMPFGSKDEPVTPEQRQEWATSVVTDAASRLGAAVRAAVTNQPSLAQPAPQPQPQAPAQQEQPQAPAPQQQPMTAAQEFGRLAQFAGFEARADSPVVSFIVDKFGVRSTREVPEAELAQVVNHYKQAGKDAFVADVNAAHDRQTAAQGSAQEPANA